MKGIAKKIDKVTKRVSQCEDALKKMLDKAEGMIKELEPHEQENKEIKFKNNNDSRLGKIFEDAKKLILNSNHYSGKIETIDFIKDKLTDEQFEGYLMGNMLKYVSRYNKKGKEYTDLLKMFTYNLWMLDEKREETNEETM